MKIYVYTDGAHSTKERAIAVGYLIRTKENYINMGSAKLSKGNISIAEAVAVGMAVEYIIKNVEVSKEDDIVEIHTDSAFVIRNFSDVHNKSKKAKLKDDQLISVWESLERLDKVCPWKFSKIGSHDAGINGNKVADRLAKYCLGTR